jgi:FAD/FMN-containing dehydrogenase
MMHVEIDRRSLLRIATVTASALAAGCGPLGTASAAPRTAPKAADWNALRRGLDGRLIRPGEASYDDARKLFNATFDTIRPSGIVYCATPSDVVECVNFARKLGIPVTSRSGGHSYAGWSSGTGLVIDVSAMNTIKASGGRAVIGAGARLVDVYDRLAAKGVSIPAGSCPTVGIAGLTLGGGLGVVSRRYGLTCDVLESAQIVTADGRLVTCDATRDPELFWACRGGGGGNFGVAVSFTYRTHPTQDVTVFFLRWPWSKAAKVISAWQAWAPTAPDAMWSNLHLTREPTLDVQAGGLYLGGRAACERLLQDLVGRVGGAASSVSIRTTSYAHAMMIMGGCSTMSAAQCHRPGKLPGENPNGKVVRDRFGAKSHFAYRPLSSAGAATLAGQVAKGGSHAVLLDAMGGAVGRVRPDATAFPHRAALFSVQYVAHGADRATWLRGAHATMRQHFGDHAYVNYIDAELTGWRQAYYGPNADRLARVKSAYDPHRLFRFPQAI